jgi:hypothetical protein
MKEASSAFSSAMPDKPVQQLFSFPEPTVDTPSATSASVGGEARAEAVAAYERLEGWLMARVAR